MSGWLGLMGKNVDEAREFILQTLVDDLLRNVNKEESGEVSFYVVADDGFDDACDYSPKLYLFRQTDCVKDEDSGIRLWDFKGKPLVGGDISSREWYMLVELARENFGGGGSGMSAIIGRGVYRIRVENQVGGAFSWTWGQVDLLELEWLVGREWESDRSIFE